MLTKYLFEDAPKLTRAEASARSALVGFQFAPAPGVFSSLLREELSVSLTAIGAPSPKTPSFATGFVFQHAQSGAKARLVLDPVWALCVVERLLGGAGSPLVPRPLSEAEEGLLCAVLLVSLDALPDPQEFLLREVNPSPLLGACLTLSLQLGALRGWALLEIEPALARRPRPASPPGWALQSQLTGHWVVGRARLSPEELASLLPSDTIIPDQLTCDEHQNGLGRLFCAGVVQEASLKDGDATLLGGWMEEKKVPLGAQVEVTIELGRIKARLQDLSQWGDGSILSLGRSPGDPVDLVVDGKVVAKGEIVRIEGELGVKLTWVAS